MQSISVTRIESSRDTPYPWLVACDANMEPNAFVQGELLDERTTIIGAPAADLSTCRSEGSNVVGVERKYDCDVVRKGPRSKNSQSGRN